MTDKSNVVPPQPEWRIVMRRVKAHGFAHAAGISAIGVAICALVDLDSLVSGRSGPVFWIAVFLLGVMFGCALLAGFFFFTEKPRPVEVLENRFSDTHVIHLSRKQ